MIGLEERNETLANVLVDCFNTLTLIFFPPLYFPCLQEKIQNNPFVLFWFSFASEFSCTAVQRSDVKHCNFEESLSKARTARINIYVYSHQGFLSNKGKIQHVT